MLLKEVAIYKDTPIFKDTDICRWLWTSKFFSECRKLALRTILRSCYLMKFLHNNDPANGKEVCKCWPLQKKPSWKCCFRPRIAEIVIHGVSFTIWDKHVQLHGGYDGYYLNNNDCPKTMNDNKNTYPQCWPPHTQRFNVMRGTQCYSKEHLKPIVFGYRFHMQRASLCTLRNHQTVYTMFLFVMPWAWL